MTTPGPPPAMPDADRLLLSSASRLAIGGIGDLITIGGKDRLNLEMSCAS